jgi:hypothetical protein
MLSQLVVVAFQSASPAVRRHLLERLVRPLGLLSLAAVAGGIFAKIRLRSHWQDVQVQFEDVQNVRASDLGALVDHVQQVSVEAVAGVAQVIAASPWMTGSAVAAVLVTVLMRQASLHTSERGVTTERSWQQKTPPCMRMRVCQRMNPLCGARGRNRTDTPFGTGF